MGDDSAKRKTLQIARHHFHCRYIGGRRLAADSQHADVLGTDISTRIHSDRTHVDKGAGLDHGAAPPYHVQTFDERLGHAAAIDDDIGASPSSVAAYGLQSLSLIGIVHGYGEGGAKILGHF